MTIHTLAERREQRRAAVEAACADIDREIRAARDDIMGRAMRRISKANPHATLDEAVGRLGKLWLEAWPFHLAGPPG